MSSEMIKLLEGTKGDPFGFDFDAAFKQSDEEPWVRVFLNKIYDISRRCTFNLLSITVGFIMSIIWGLVMASTQFFVIWYVLVVDLFIIVFVYIHVLEHMDDIWMILIQILINLGVLFL